MRKSRKKIKNRENIEKNLRDDEEKLKVTNSFSLDEALNRLEKTKNRDLKDADERVEAVKDLQKILDSKKIQLKDAESDIVALKIELNMHQTDLEMAKEMYNLKLLNDLFEKRTSLNKEIELEKINVIKMDFDNNRLMVKKWEEKSKELGFSNVNDFLKFKGLIEEFKDSYNELQKTSNNFGTRISKFAEKLNTQAKNIDDCINKDRTKEINKLLDSMSQKSNTESLNALGEFICKWLQITEKTIYKREDVLEFCSDRKMIISIMSKTEKNRYEEGEILCKELPCVKYLGEQITALEGEIDCPMVDDDDDTVLKQLNKELEAIEIEIDTEEDPKEKEKKRTLKIKKREEITNRRNELRLDKINFLDEKNKKK